MAHGKIISSYSVLIALITLTCAGCATPKSASLVRRTELEAAPKTVVGGPRIGILSWRNMETDPVRNASLAPLALYTSDRIPVRGHRFALADEMSAELAARLQADGSVQEARVLSVRQPNYPGYDYLIVPTMHNYERRTKKFTYGLWVFGFLLAPTGLPVNQVGYSMDWSWVLVDPLTEEAVYKYQARINANYPLRGMPPMTYLYGFPPSNTQSPAPIIRNKFHRHVDKFITGMIEALDGRDSRTEARQASLERHWLSARAAEGFYTGQPARYTNIISSFRPWPPED